MLARGDKFARELLEEMRGHRDMKERELQKAGASGEEARYAANRAFGNELDARERSGEAWGWRWLEDFVQDLRFGLRMLRKNMRFTGVAVLTLALGIGANTTIFTLVHAVLLRPLPFRNAAQMVLIQGKTTQGARTGVSYADMEDWRQQAQSFEGISAWMAQSVNLTGQEKPERLRGGFVSANFFELLGVTAEQGRVFLPGEDVPRAGRVAVVNHSLWVRRFGADEHFVGKQLILNGSVFTVVGILPEGFDFPLDWDRNEVWLPISTFPGFSRKRSDNWFVAIASRKAGVSEDSAQAEMSTIAKRLAKEYPDEDGQRSALVTPLQVAAAKEFRGLLLVLLGAVGLVLLIACANVVNLLLARGAARRKEISLRAALGAGRLRLVRQVLSETVALWVIAGTLGLGIGTLGLKLVLATSPMTIPPGMNARVSGAVLLFTLLVTGATAIVAGLIPALQYSSGDVEQGLKESGRIAGDGRATTRLRDGLLVMQVTMSLILLAGAGLMLRTMANLTALHPGFEAKNVLTLEYRLPQTEYAAPAEQLNFHKRVVERVKQLPGVKAAAISVGIPFTGNIGSEPIVLMDREAPPPGQEPVAQFNTVDADYFRTLRIPVIRGRGFQESDASLTQRVAVINQTMAERFWKDGDAVGRQIELVDEKQPATIVGVVGNVKQDRLDEKAPLQVYFAYRQNPFRFATLSVRTDGNPMGFVGAVRDAVWSVDRNQPMWKVRALETVLKNSVGDRRYLAALLSVYAGLATFLAAVGIYGVLTYVVNQRVREIGVRIALGAQASDTVGMVVGGGMKRVGVGIALGSAGALALTRVLKTMLFGIGPNDPATLTVGVSVLALAGLLACWLPARRASRMDPMRILRME
jgi:putative ABC transport system permease protein